MQSEQSFMMFLIFVEPSCGERDIVVIISVQCMCVHLFEFVLAITYTFMHGFQNDLVQLLSSRSRSAISNNCSGRLKVKVAL